MIKVQNLLLLKNIIDQSYIVKKKDFKTITLTQSGKNLHINIYKSSFCNNFAMSLCNQQPWNHFLVYLSIEIVDLVDQL